MPSDKETYRKKTFSDRLKKENRRYNDDVGKRTNIAYSHLYNLSGMELRELTVVLKEIQKLKERNLGFDTPVDTASIIVDLREEKPVEEILPTEDDEEDRVEEEELALYNELKYRDPTCVGEVEIYLKHHTFEGRKLSTDEMDFARADLMHRLNGAQKEEKPDEKIIPTNQNKNLELEKKDIDSPEILKSESLQNKKDDNIDEEFLPDIVTDRDNKLMSLREHMLTVEKQWREEDPMFSDWSLEYLETKRTNAEDNFLKNTGYSLDDACDVDPQGQEDEKKELDDAGLI